MHGWINRSVDLSSLVAAAITQALPPPADNKLSPEAHAFESVRTMTRSQLDEVMRSAKIEGLTNDVWVAIKRLNK